MIPFALGQGVKFKKNFGPILGEVKLDIIKFKIENKRKWLSGRASPCQGEGREFESRLPLQIFSQKIRYE